MTTTIGCDIVLLKDVNHLGGAQMKIKVGLLDKDTNYLKRMTIAFTSRFADKIEVYSFTKLDIAIEEVAERGIDVFLSSTEFKIDITTLPPKCGFAYLVDLQDVDMIDDIVTVSKFQKAELIYKKIVSIYSEQANNMSKNLMNANIHTKITYFTSASGGCGTTTIACAAAKRMAKYGRRVLYLNLEYISSTDVYFHGDGEGTMSDIIYSLKSKKSNIGLKIESCLRHDEYGVNFFAPCNIALDTCELNAENINTLIKEIQLSDNFDNVIIDGGFSFNKEMYNLLDFCNDCIFVSDGSLSSNIKFKNAYNCLQILDKQYGGNISEKIRLIYNRFSSHNSEMLDIEEIAVLGGIQRIEGAKPQELIAQIMEKTILDNLV